MRKVLFFLLFFAVPSFAWVSGDNQKIVSLIVWENADAGQMHFKLSNGTWCYLPPGQKVLQSIILALYASGKPAEIHCYDVADSTSAAVPKAHKLHRIIAK